MPQPDTDRGEFDEGQVVYGPLLVSGGDRAVVLELVKKALDQISVAIQEAAESGLGDPARLRFDVRPTAASVRHLA